MESFHSNIWWSDGVELIDKGFTYEKGRTLFRKEIQCVDDIRDIEQKHFLTWERAREKFNLTPMEIGDWIELTGKIVEQWRHKLEDDSDTTHPGQWIGFYANGEEDRTCVMQCVTSFSPPCMQLHNLSMPLLCDALW